MCFLIQTVLFVGASFSVWLTVQGLHAPFWVGIVAGFVFLALAWIAYEMYQTNHPEWWPSWDEGLPQSMRMANAFVPVVMVFVFMLILFPVFHRAKEKAEAKRQRIAIRQKMDAQAEKTTVPQTTLQKQRKSVP